MHSLPNFQGVGGIAPRFIFAWSSDLAGRSIEAELSRYLEVDGDALDRPAATILCIVGKGYCYANPAQGSVVWQKVGSTDGIQEVVNFIGGIANSLIDLRMQRFGMRFGHYIIPDGNHEILARKAP